MKTLFTNGDSWTFGSEIAGPHMLTEPGKGEGMTHNFKKGMGCWEPHNNYYRIPRIWPTILANLTGAENVNLSWPARSNDTIYESTLGWVLNYLKTGKPEDLTVIVGWSSFERRNFIFEDLDGKLEQYTIWPAMAEDKYYESDVAKKFFKFYILHMWNEREALTRFIEQNFNLHTFLQSRGIKHHFFNSFYMPGMPKEHLSPLNEWKPMDLNWIIDSWKPMGGWQDQRWNHESEITRLRNQWATIPEEVFLYKKDFKSFKGYIDETVSAGERMINMHPSPVSHATWANHLYEKLFK